MVAAALRREQPFTAQELVRDLARRGVGRATVFRTLDVLVAVGVLSRIHGIERGERCVRYTPCAPEHHHHIVCTVCGRVEELASEKLDAQLVAASRARGFRPIAHSVEITGVCSDHA